jgi:hypothetical protein
MVSWFPLARLRAAAFVAAAGILLSGCAGGAGAYDASLSPAQNQLRQSNARFNQTVGEGAGAGALLGGIAGLALGGRNRGQAALIGAAAGGALGAGAGYAVAQNNLNRSSTEAQFSNAIQQASADADSFRASAQSSREVADQATADVNRLKGALRSGQITQAQYRSKLAGYRIDNDAMTRSITEARKSAAAMRQNARFTTGANSGQLLRSAADVEASGLQTEQNQARMSRMLDGTSL